MSFSWVAGFLFLAIFHAATIEAPPAYYDDAAFADFALHRELSMWKEILPASHQHLQYFYLFRSIPPHIAMLGEVLERFGAALWTVRAAPLACALVGLGVLIFLLRRFQMPLLCLVGVLAYGLSGHFFVWAHSARQEGPVFLIAMLTAAWFLLKGGRVSAVSAGALAALAATFHLAAVLLFAVIFLLMARTGRELSREPRYAWYALGFLLGAPAALELMDADSLGRYFQFFKDIDLNAASVAGRGGDVWTIGENLFVRLVPGTQSPMFAAGLIVAFLWRARRYRELSEVERTFLWIGGGFWAAYVGLSPKSQAAYLLYSLPWLYVIFFHVLDDLRRGKLRPDPTDFLLAACAGAACFVSRPHFGALFLGGSIFFVRLLIAGRAAPLRHVAAATGFLVLLVWHRGDAFAQIGYLAAYLSENRLPFLLLALLWPFVLRITPGGIALRGITEPQTALVAGALLIAGTFQSAAAGARLISRSRAAAQCGEECRKTLSRLRGQERVLAPMALWLYAPDARFQDAEILFHGSRLVPMRPLQFITDYDPTMILLDETQWEKLQTLAEASRSHRVEVRIDRPLPSPLGTLYEGRVFRSNPERL